MSDPRNPRQSRGHRARTFVSGFPRLLPGLLLAALCAGVAYWVNYTVPLLSALLVAIILGVLLRNLNLIPAAAEPGFAFANRTILRAGVVLLGLRLSIPEVIDLGWGVIAVIMATVAATYAIGIGLGKLMRLRRPTMVLMATGTAICGAAAVAAMSAVVQAEDDDEEGAVDEAAATAVASVTLFGTVALLALPSLAALISLTPTETGVWVGAAVHEVGQVVAGAGIAGANLDPSASAALLDTALVTKLGRVAMLAPLVAIVGALENRRTEKLRAEKIARAEADDVLEGRTVDHGPAGKRAPIMPLFVAGFLVMVVIRSVFTLPAGFLEGADVAATALLTAAMVAMGSGVRIARLVKTGGKALALGAITSIVVAIVAFVGVQLAV